MSCVINQLVNWCKSWADQCNSDSP